MFPVKIAGRNVGETILQHRCTYFCASAKALGLLIKTKPDLGIFESCKNACSHLERL